MNLNQKPRRMRQYWFCHIVAPLLAGAALGGYALLLAYGGYRRAVFLEYLKAPLTVLLNILPAILLVLLLTAITGKSWIGFSLAAAVIIPLSAVNYFKLYLRDDPLYFEDLLLMREAGYMTGEYKLFFSVRLMVCVIFTLMIALSLFFLAKEKTTGRRRTIAAVTVVALSCVSIPLYTSDAIYEKTLNTTYLNQWSATQVYVSRGFLYPFLYSVQAGIDTEPRGYDKSQAEADLLAYRDQDIPTGQKPHIIGIMLEAFCDFSDMGIAGLDPAVYEKYHALENESYSGRLLTNIFAGGTIDTERCFLTGYTMLRDFRSPVNSYVRYFAEQGYTTYGSHPCYEWFYNRINVNEYLGFQEYAFVENYYGESTGGEVGYDDLFFPAAIELFREHMDSPSFGFHVTYQGHGPYSATTSDWGTEWMSNEGYSDSTYYIFNNYLGSIADTIIRLSNFVDYLRSIDEPVILVVFGDHKPWLGDNGSVYAELGITMDTSTLEGLHNYYGTRYFIWANDMAKELVGSDFQGQGPTISPAFLMDELFIQCGWEGPAYMQAGRQLKDVISVVHRNGFYMEEGEIVINLSEENKELMRRFAGLEYYWRRQAVVGE